MKSTHIFLALCALISATGAAQGALLTTQISGNLMFEYIGGEAGPSLQEFGLGTPATGSTLADRNMVFQIDYRANATVFPSKVVSMGYFYAGSKLDFYNLSDWSGNLYGYSSRLSLSPTPSDLAVFSDTDNSLGFGGSIVRNLGIDSWVLYLDDAWSYSVDDDDNEMIIKVWVDQSAIPPKTMVPIPQAMWLLGSGLLGLMGIARMRQVVE